MDWIGCGCQGTILWAVTRRVKAFWPPEVAEAKAIMFALKTGRKFGVQDIILESDCKLVIDRLSKSAISSMELDTVLGDILYFCTFFRSVIWSHVKRDGNSVAHSLAKLIPLGVEQIWENHCPQDVAPYVLMDRLSSN